MSEGTGVRRFTLMRAMAAGRWPCRAPTKNSRDEAKMAPLSAPNVEQATNTGMVHDMTPSIFSPNSCEKPSQLSQSAPDG